MFFCLKDADALVKRNAATCVREVAKHTPELAQLVVNAGGHAALIHYLSTVTGPSRLPAIMALGYIGAFSETLATAIIIKQGLLPLKAALAEGEEDHIRAAAAWSLGQLGRHTPDHAKAIAQADILRPLITLATEQTASNDTKQKAFKAAKAILTKTTYTVALEPLLLSVTDARITALLVAQFAKVLPNQPAARKSFVTSRALQKIQELKIAEETALKAGTLALPTETTSTEGVEGATNSTVILGDQITLINGLYPNEIVQFYSPNYAETLISQLADA